MEAVENTTSSSETTAKPTEPPKNSSDQKEDVLTVRIKDQGGEETFFRVKTKTQMGKIFGAYAQRKGVQLSSLRFLLDGERINPEDTSISLELEDGDQIDVLLEQFGGCRIEPSCELFFTALLVVSGTYLLFMAYVITESKIL